MCGHCCLQAQTLFLEPKLSHQHCRFATDIRQAPSLQNVLPLHGHSSPTSSSGSRSPSTPHSLHSRPSLEVFGYQNKDLTVIKIDMLRRDAANFRSWRNSFITPLCSIERIGRDTLLHWIMAILWLRSRFQTLLMFQFQSLLMCLILAILRDLNAHIAVCSLIRSTCRANSAFSFDPALRLAYTAAKGRGSPYKWWPDATSLTFSVVLTYRASAP